VAQGKAASKDFESLNWCNTLLELWTVRAVLCVLKEKTLHQKRFDTNSCGLNVMTRTPLPTLVFLRPAHTHANLDSHHHLSPADTQQIFIELDPSLLERYNDA
jgi:hypothetical protein